MQDVMLDLETLGTASGCVVLAIGACEFNQHGLGRVFYRVVNRHSCLLAGLQVDPDTEAWWAGQPEEAKLVLAHAQSPAHSLPLAAALHDFDEWFPTGACVWGNGADFDLPILPGAYRAVGYARPPWQLYAGRCYRTIKNLARHILLEREGVYHNAADDAKSQARHLIKLRQALGLG